MKISILIIFKDIEFGIFLKIPLLINKVDKNIKFSVIIFIFTQ